MSMNWESVCVYVFHILLKVNQLNNRWMCYVHFQFLQPLYSGQQHQQQHPSYVHSAAEAIQSASRRMVSEHSSQPTPSGTSTLQPAGSRLTADPGSQQEADRQQGPSAAAPILSPFFHFSFPVFSNSPPIYLFRICFVGSGVVVSLVAVVVVALSKNLCLHEQLCIVLYVSWFLE